jgi:hypothetical protein
MKKKFLVALILVTTIFTSCKNEKKADQPEVKVPEVVDNNFKVTIDVIVKKDDDFCLYYTDGSGPDFKEPIWSGVKGSETSQKLVYVIPKENFPSQVRLDFGLKENQEAITLKSVTFEYKGSKREIAGAELGIYFRPDESKCTFVASTGLIKALVKGGKRQSPSLYPQEAVLGPELLKLGK